jgi:GINS complex subunit 4
MEEDDDIEINENVKLYETLKRAWNDEKNAPILLKFKSTEVARFQTLLASREREIEEMENSANESGDGNEMLLSAIGREELNRAKYVLRSYLRTRIKKIQQFPVHVLQQWDEKNSEETEETEEADVISEKEYEFTWALVKAYEEHAQSVLANFPISQHFTYRDAFIEYEEFVEGKKNEELTMEELTMVSHPNEANKMVFIRILEDVGMHQLDDGTDEGDKIDLEKGKILFCKFQQFKGLLESSEEGGTPRAELL